MTHLESITPQVIERAKEHFAKTFGMDIAKEAVSDALLSLVEHYDPHRGASPVTCLYVFAYHSAILMAKREKRYLPFLCENMDVRHDEREPVPPSISILEMVDRIIDKLNAAARQPGRKQRYNVQLASEILDALMKLIEEDALPDDCHRKKERQLLYKAVAERTGRSVFVIENAFVELRKCMA